MRKTGMMGITTQNNDGGLKDVTQSMMGKHIASQYLPASYAPRTKLEPSSVPGERPSRCHISHTDKDTTVAVFLTACSMDTMRCHFFSGQKIIHNLNVIRKN